MKTWIGISENTVYSITLFSLFSQLPSLSSLFSPFAPNNHQASFTKKCVFLKKLSSKITFTLFSIQCKTTMKGLLICIEQIFIEYLLSGQAKKICASEAFGFCLEKKDNNQINNRKIAESNQNFEKKLQ